MLVRVKQILLGELIAILPTWNRLPWNQNGRGNKPKGDWHPYLTTEIGPVKYEFKSYGDLICSDGWA